MPIALLLTAFRTTDYLDFPNLENLVETYEWYPKTYIRATVLGAAESIAKNALVIDRKARELNRAMAVLFLTVIVILGWKAAEAYYGPRFGPQAVPATSPAPDTFASRPPDKPATRRDSVP